ncbi:MAG: hypothetical protein V7785_21420 [Bermanella sp.]
MQIQQNPMAFTQSTGTQQKMGPPPNEKGEVGESGSRSPQGPPKNGMPPGLDAAVSTLSSNMQKDIEDVLSELNEEQKLELKSALDELKPQAQDMSLEEIGEEFANILSTITQSNSEEDSEHIVDTYI